MSKAKAEAPGCSRNSIELGGGTGNAGLVSDPVHFPCRAAVIRVGLLKVRHIGIEIGPAKPDEDGFVVDCILCKEFADAILKFTDVRWIENANSLIGPIETLLVSCGIVRAQRKPFNAAVRTFGMKLFDFGRRRKPYGRRRWCVSYVLRSKDNSRDAGSISFSRPHLSDPSQHQHY